MTLSLSYYPVGLTQLRVWIHFQLAFKTMNKLGMFVCVCVCMYVCVFTCVFVFAMWSYLGNFEMVNMEQKRALTSIRIGPVYVWMAI